MKKELLILIGVFFILTLSIHFKELLINPFEHILNLSKSGAYGLGIFHPLIFTFIGYILILVPRVIISLFRRILK